jgi:hypothetical protein
MWDRYDPRWSDGRDRDDFADRSRGSRGSLDDREHGADRDPPDVFTKAVDLPRGRERGRCEIGIACIRSTERRVGCSPPSAPFVSSQRAISTTVARTLERPCATSNERA